MTMYMEETKLDIPILQPGEKIIGHAYVTEEESIVFTPHSGAREVVLAEAPAVQPDPPVITQTTTDVYIFPRGAVVPTAEP
jgi:hypothetical protein